MQKQSSYEENHVQKWKRLCPKMEKAVFEAFTTTVHKPSQPSFSGVLPPEKSNNLSSYHGDF
jgi:hypothetical protein